MSEDMYLKLREALDKMPGGFPETDSGVELKILKKLFTPEQAEIALNMKPMPEPVDKIAERLGIDKSEAARKLEKMSKDGLIYRVRMGDKILYMALQFAVGVYEFNLNRIDRELSELMEEYIPHISKSWMKTPTKQLRILPVESSLESAPSVAPYNQVREMVKKQDLISVAQCICRKEQTLLGNQCDRPQELCFQFGMAANYYLENGMSRKIDVEEALKLLNLAEDNAMVLSPTNAQNILSLCCCCKCCCGVLRGLSQFDRPADLVHSGYQAKIDPELCSACETCVDRCQIDAIKENGDVMEIDTARCIGCGLCVSTCPDEAISMVEKEKAYVPPENMVAMMMQITKERNLT